MGLSSVLSDNGGSKWSDGWSLRSPVCVEFAPRTVFAVSTKEEADFAARTIIYSPSFEMKNLSFTYYCSLFFSSRSLPTSESRRRTSCARDLLNRLRYYGKNRSMVKHIKQYSTYRLDVEVNLFSSRIFDRFEGSLMTSAFISQSYVVHVNNRQEKIIDKLTFGYGFQEFRLCSLLLAYLL